MGKNVEQAFLNNEVKTVSYIGKPKDDSVMFVTKKVEHLVDNLLEHQGCIVFAETGITPCKEILQHNVFFFSDKPQMEYVRYVNRIFREKQMLDARRKFTLTEQGYYIGENVSIGKNAYIELGCVIGHDVFIGDDACILTGSVIKNAVIGNRFLANENALVGTNGFTMTEDESGNKIRIPTLGKVEIGDDVEVGALTHICCGSAGNTIIEDGVKIDALVHIGHDAYLSKNTEITAGSVIGGFAKLGEHSYIGINATVRNRITLGECCVVGMGAVVTKDVSAHVTVAGNPARVFG